MPKLRLGFIMLITLVLSACGPNQTTYTTASRTTEVTEPLGCAPYCGSQTIEMYMTNLNRVDELVAPGEPIPVEPGDNLKTEVRVLNPWEVNFSGATLRVDLPKGLSLPDQPDQRHPVLSSITYPPGPSSFVVELVVDGSVYQGTLLTNVAVLSIGNRTLTYATAAVKVKTRPQTVGPSG